MSLPLLPLFGPLPLPVLFQHFHPLLAFLVVLLVPLFLLVIEAEGFLVLQSDEHAGLLDLLPPLLLLLGDLLHEGHFDYGRHFVGFEGLVDLLGLFGLQLGDVLVELLLVDALWFVVLSPHHVELERDGVVALYLLELLLLLLPPTLLTLYLATPTLLGPGPLSLPPGGVTHDGIEGLFLLVHVYVLVVQLGLVGVDGLGSA